VAGEIIAIMSNDQARMHVYQRIVKDERQDSLSLIAGLIEPGQSVLDLGMGTGGLGQFLSQRGAIVADGVTLNAAEADIARTWYRRAVVADLDRDSLTDLFGAEQYDCIVCADVLEHLKAPQHVLAQCKRLLKPGGRLLTSVPNAGYCGLVAELMQGEFRYRPEGLLDATHLRFFTRKSLSRFFQEQGWATLSVTTTQRSLLDSEFQVAFDSLPPAVARHLLAVPDALSYQFISVLQPADQRAVAPAGDVLVTPTEAEGGAMGGALFSSQLYLARQGKYEESGKLVVAGRIGDARQTLVFDIASSAEPYSRIRLDPADRPGFLRLHSIELALPDGQTLWRWQATEHPLQALAGSAHQDIVFSPPWELAAGALLLLYGDDPWLELPLDTPALDQLSRCGGRLELCVGWPMSADFIEARNVMSALQADHAQTELALRQEVASLDQQCHVLQDSNRSIAFTLDQTRENLHLVESAAARAGQAAQDEKQGLVAELRNAQRERLLYLGQVQQLTSYLQSIEQSNVFRYTRPLVHAKMRVDRLLGRTSKSDTPSSMSPTSPALIPAAHPVDIIVPVYRGLDDTQCCLESVLRSRCQTPWRLVVINDCSPEPEVTQWLRDLAAREPRIELLENEQNLGFVGTVNRGMALHPQHDVLLLNSDAEVANDWLDRIQGAAYSSARVASVTPFSNNATICSYPRFCQDNELPVGHDTASLDRLFAQHLAGRSVPVPTGVGFCMYIRRACLQEVGLFDVDNFGKGYGEENDFCVRAQEAGWLNLHALDTFVRHAGGVSFGDSKSARELQAMETLRRLHPQYDGEVQRFVQDDPARIARLTIDVARIVTAGRPVVLSVTHNREGGTLRHIQELADRLHQHASFLRLAPVPSGVELRLEGSGEAFALRFVLPQEQATLLDVLRQFKVGHIHYHHLLGHRPDICDLPEQLGVGYDFTAHDFYSYCPQISLTDHTDRYCGEQGLNQCHRCLRRNPAPGGEGIESWRDRHARLLSRARYVLTPSADTAQRIKRFVPTARVCVVPHATLELEPTMQPVPRVRRLTDRQALKVVVLGALSRIKGADVLEEVATLAARQDQPIEFHLLGFGYRNLRTQPKARLTVHGAYDDKDLQQLLQWLQPDLVWFPAVWPETYSYTLSASLESGLPIVAPSLGAFAERLQQREWTWLCDWDWSAAQWLAFFARIRAQHFCSGNGPDVVDPTTPMGAGPQAPFSYRESYFQGLPDCPTVEAAGLAELAHAIAQHQSQSLAANQASTVIKSSTLRTLARLRAHPALSPLARLVPAHMQRRVKSWLRK